MKPIKKFIIIKLAILILAQSLTLSSNAFFTCPELKCRRKVNYSFVQTSSRITLLRNKSNNFLVNNGGNNNDKNKNAGNNKGGIVPQNNPGNGNFNCQKNMKLLSNEKQLLECQIDSAEKKASEVLNLVNRLAKALDNLLNIMQGAPVCTGMGYTLREYNTFHNFSTNRAILKLILEDISKLKNELANVKLNCDNCDDENALEAELEKLKLIKNTLDTLILDFKSELNIINNKMNLFVARINTVIRLHSRDVRGIMIECEVTRSIASAMSAARFRALRAFRNFVDQRRKIFADINNIDLSQSDCNVDNNNNNELEEVFKCGV